MSPATMSPLFDSSYVTTGTLLAGVGNAGVGVGVTTMTPGVGATVGCGVGVEPHVPIVRKTVSLSRSSLLR